MGGKKDITVVGEEVRGRVDRMTRETEQGRTVRGMSSIIILLIFYV